MQNQLVRSETDKKIFGVCGGLADYLNVDPVLVRLGFVLLTFASGVGLVAYVAMAVLLPSEISVGSSVSWPPHGDSNGKAPTTSSLAERRDSGPRLVAGILIATGVFFLLQNLGLAIDLAFLGPLVLIGVGAWLLLKRGQEA